MGVEWHRTGLEIRGEIRRTLEPGADGRQSAGNCQDCQAPSLEFPRHPREDRVNIRSKHLSVTLLQPSETNWSVRR